MSLDDDSWRRVRALFDRAVDLPSEDRAALLRSESAEVRGEVERLIAADSSSSALLERGIRSRTVDDAAWEATLVPGRSVGPFRLVRAIGSGGMGLVFEAEEASPRRRVALKTVRAEFFTPELLRRFANEVQLLARLEHPGIARIYSSGTFERAGVECPYYTMELVEEARTILRFADEHALDVRARLELFLQACDAVEHGHRKGVIHRDLKPGNLLVDARGRVKVIDFGLARPEDPAAFGADPLQTRAGLVFGTLAYMSPEHVSGRPLEIDTRSDVHSLGCILCELVAGRPPHELYDVPIRTALERIEQADPDLPASLPRELAWIVRRAIERDPARRYPTAGGLAADVRRFLAGQPVEAAPPSRGYALASFARRHKGLLAAGLAVLAALLVGLGREARAREARGARGRARGGGRRLPRGRVRPGQRLRARRRRDRARRGGPGLGARRRRRARGRPRGPPRPRRPGVPEPRRVRAGRAPPRGGGAPRRGAPGPGRPPPPAHGDRPGRPARAHGSLRGGARPVAADDSRRGGDPPERRRLLRQLQPGDLRVAAGQRGPPRRRSTAGSTASRSSGAGRRTCS